MESLSEDFAVLDGTFGRGLERIAGELTTRLEQMLKVSVEATLLSWWRKHGERCPATVERFAELYRQDIAQLRYFLLESQYEEQHDHEDAASKYRDEYILGLSVYSKVQTYKRLAALHIKDHRRIELTQYKLLLVKKAIFDEINDDTLSLVTNDTEGATAVYTRMASV